MPVIRNPLRGSQEEKVKTSRAINAKLDLLDKKMDHLYKDIYISRPDNRQNLDKIIDDLDSALDRLQGEDISVSGMSELLRRIDSKTDNSSQQLIDSVQELFSDGNLIGTLAQNDNMHRYIAGENYSYDLICKYMPKLKMALEIVRDNTLCSDNFAKNFINPQIYQSSKEAARTFSINCKKIEQKYKFSKFFEKTYWNTSKYGEDFIYIVPYEVAFKRLIKRDNQRTLQGTNYYGTMNILSEEYGYSPLQETVISGGFNKTKEFGSFLESVSTEGITKQIASEIRTSNLMENCEVNLYFNDTNMLQAPVQEVTTLSEMTELEHFKSLMSIRESSIQEKTSLEKQYDEVNYDNDKITKAATATTFDGLILPDNLNRDADKIDKSFNGAVVERIPRENILPLYMGEMCFGYYHFEFGKDPGACGFCGGHHNGIPGVSNGGTINRDMDEQQEELLLRFISARISSAIDTHFINANKDLKEEIYALLHYNEQFNIQRTNNIGVTFIPADDIVHCFFEQDEHTHRGISDLHDSLIPAMLYVLLYLTDIIGKVTRSTDKRIYYVKQNVETNIAKTMMNVVKQIKKGNMGMRQIQSMSSILNIVGKYNDYIIPQSQSGDPPIQFEVMSGQDIQTPSELMEKMEEMAINPIVPFEFVNSIMQQDFAIRFSMSNTRFLKFVFGRQRDTERFGTEMYTKIYNYEYDENYPEVKLTLPPPIYMVMQNNNQLLDNIEQTAQKIIDTYLIAEEDDVKDEFKKLYIRDALGAYIDYDKVESLIEAAKVNLNADQRAATDDGEAADNYL